MRQSLRDVGAIISQKGAPKETGPYIIALTGNGNVSQGALDLLKELPIRHVTVAELARLATSPGNSTLLASDASDTCLVTSRKFIYLVHVKPEDYLVDIRGHPYDRATYYSRPEMSNSVFYQKVSGRPPSTSYMQLTHPRWLPILVYSSTGPGGNLDFLG